MANYKVTQKQFDILMKAAKALDEQGEVSTCGSYCKYRGPNGTKCFVGHLISDEMYEESMEDEHLVHLIQKGVVEGFNTSDLELLHWLQVYHDNSRLWEKERETNPKAMRDYIEKRVEVA